MLRFSRTYPRSLIHELTIGDCGLQGRICSVFIGLLLLFTTFVPIGQAQTLRDRRPADLYVLEYSADQAICRKVLMSLNEEHRLTPDQMTVDSPNMGTELLLHSDLQVAWKHKDYLDHSGLRGVLEYTEADITNNGHAKFLYRETAFAAHIWSDMLFVTSTAPSELKSDEPLSVDTMQKIEGYEKSNQGETWANYLRLDDQSAPELYSVLPAQARPISPIVYDANFVRVDQRVLLMITDARAADYMMHGRSEQITVFVLAYRSPHDLALSCELKSAKMLSMRR